MEKTTSQSVINAILDPDSFEYQQDIFQDFAVLLLDNGIINEDTSDAIINFTETEDFKKWWDKIDVMKWKLLKRDTFTKISDINLSDMVKVYSPEKGWIEGCVMEKCNDSVFIVCEEGYCIWSDKVKKIYK